MDQCLLITGASRGIGKATATLFQEKGWRVVNLSRTPCSLQDVTNLAIDLENNLISQKDAILSAIGAPDRLCLTHNAALLFKDTVQNLPEIQLRRALEVNVIAPALLNTLVIPCMKAGSSIIYVASALATIGVANAASYTLTKHALLGLMRATCQDLKPLQITTTCVCPGFTDTEMLKEYLGLETEKMKTVIQQAGATRMILPHEIAETIFFSATQSVMNGAFLHVTAGQSV